MKRVIALSLLLALSLSACNTWRGFGKDLEHVGNKIENSGKK